MYGLLVYFPVQNSNEGLSQLKILAIYKGLRFTAEKPTFQTENMVLVTDSWLLHEQASFLKGDLCLNKA